MCPVRPEAGEWVAWVRLAGGKKRALWSRLASGPTWGECWAAALVRMPPASVEVTVLPQGTMP